jgi:hypothetical protein
MYAASGGNRAMQNTVPRLDSGDNALVAPARQRARDQVNFSGETRTLVSGVGAKQEFVVKGRRRGHRIFRERRGSSGPIDLSGRSPHDFARASCG